MRGQKEIVSALALFSDEISNMVLTAEWIADRNACHQLVKIKCLLHGLHPPHEPFSLSLQALFWDDCCNV